MANDNGHNGHKNGNYANLIMAIIMGHSGNDNGHTGNDNGHKWQ